MSWQRIVGWAMAALGFAILVTNLILTARLGGRIARMGEPQKEFVLRLDAVERDMGELRAAQASAGANMAALKERVDSLWKRLESAREPQVAPMAAHQLAPPPGKLISTFDASTDGWAVAEWGRGSLRRLEDPAWVRRGRGALALGYTYGDKPPAAICPLDPGTAISGVRLYARTRARDIELAVGVEDPSGNKYEKLFSLRVDEQWKLVSAMLSEMRPAKGSSGTAPKAPRAIYVADRSEDTAGGNILLIDDVTIEPTR